MFFRGEPSPVELDYFSGRTLIHPRRQKAWILVIPKLGHMPIPRLASTISSSCSAPASGTLGRRPAARRNCLRLALQRVTAHNKGEP